ncbi:MAG: exodeoxyribonuclease VII small subunit [Bacteroidaceae bacterium]
MATRKQTYDEAMKRLEQLVAQIEGNEGGIDALAEKLEEAQRLMRFCKEKLYKADAEIQNLLQADEGQG